ncbi:beta-glucosidase-like glycosyl hydrolase [Arcticibacter pallidicorallinus]|uniref:beta-N-acetylhexosaminidase n=1 Tax=Arcticibacter pallidicorallinus TaxID=1259464 RepID=A0A2T0U790_9SPHI|nr:glycoside hydrolase family 3 protein [Arcticibacter pallidicorallinus]PRY53777.1 beta-glucosidase-like glycosyl hydrolase [Arcticibacter pallidicorallinus]
MRAIRPRLFIFFTILLTSYSLSAQHKKPFYEADADKDRWVDSVFNKLNKREKVAQMFFVRAHTDKGKAYEDLVEKMIRRGKVGGLVFFQGGPGRQAALTNRYQSVSSVPLLIAMDAEWGVAMRLDSTIAYPYQMTLGAIQDTSLIYQMGREIGRDFRALGMHLNFAPVVDINNNPANPVIGYRSFGDNKYNVATKSLAYMQGLQDEGILVSIKHFPGHGDTNVDSHHDLPQLKFSKERLDSLELYPFKQLIDKGASGVMIAHMNIPSLDATKNLPSTLSEPIVKGLLKKELGFRGLAITDAMEMKGVVKFFPDGEADVRAVIAGNDVIELSENTKRAIKLVKKAIRQGRIEIQQIDTSVRKILEAKYWAGLSIVRPLSTEHISAAVMRPESSSLVQRLTDASTTVLKSDSLIKTLDLSKKTAIISLGTTEVSTFQRELKSRIPNSTNFLMSKIGSATDIRAMLREVAKFDQVIMAIHDYRKRPQSSLDYNTQLKIFIAELSKLNTITCVFANPYTIAGLPGIESSKSIIVNYENSPQAQRSAAKVVTGQMPAMGKLPVSINTFFRNGDGINYFPEPKPVLGQVNY